MFIEDGATDQTWKLMKQFYEDEDYCSAIRFSRNRGQQNAQMAGLMFSMVYADCVITIEGDLQQDINSADSFLSDCENGSEIVYRSRAIKKRLLELFLLIHHYFTVFFIL